MPVLIKYLLLFCTLGSAVAQQLVTFPLGDKAGGIQGDLYGKGSRAVILAHGGRFNKESWKEQAETLAGAGLRVLAVRFRGDGFNPDGSPGAFGSGEDNAADVRAAVAYLQHTGARHIYAIGGSLGGDAVGDAVAQLKPGVVSRMILLGSSGGDMPEKLTGRKLFIVARNDSNSAGPRLPGITKSYEKASEPKRLLVVEGAAHAQFLFKSGEGPRVMEEIIRFLTAR